MGVDSTCVELRPAKNNNPTNVSRFNDKLGVRSIAFPRTAREPYLDAKSTENSAGELSFPVDLKYTYARLRCLNLRAIEPIAAISIRLEGSGTAAMCSPSRR